jgi:hypothetical protein
MRKSTVIILCALFTTASSTLGQDFTCPIPISQSITTPRVCPDPLKEQRNRYLWDDNFDDTGLSFGRGKCAAGLECWPAFHTPTKRGPVGSEGNKNLYYVVHKVDERTVNTSGPSCSVFTTLTFEFPTFSPGKCFKPFGTCLADADWINYPSTGCITGLFFQGPCTRSAAFRSRCEGYLEEECECEGGGYMSPIVIDVDRSGFSMTNAAGGVIFNMLNDGVPLQISWTACWFDECLFGSRPQQQRHYR